ncbi:MAG: RHS repeat-associated core domain-containing protein [Terracidiphilus sp.]
MQAQTSIRVPDTPMTVSLACVLSAASADTSISTGKERDTESGNDYFEARYYSSAMGRFMSPDWNGEDDPEPVPYADLGDPQTLNLYAYAGNNPLVHKDDDGHFYNGLQCNCPDGAGLTPEDYARMQAAIDNFFLALRRGTESYYQQFFGKKTPTVAPVVPAAQSTPADPNQNDDEKQKKTEHGEKRKAQARQGDANRQGDTQRTTREGKAYHDADTGNTIYVRGGHVVVETPDGEYHTSWNGQTSANTAQRVESGKWEPIQNPNRP